MFPGKYIFKCFRPWSNVTEFVSHKNIFERRIKKAFLSFPDPPFVPFQIPSCVLLKRGVAKTWITLMQPVTLKKNYTKDNI